MEKANDPGGKTAMKATVGKDAVTVKTEQTKSISSKEKPAAEKGKTPAKQTANKAAASKEGVAVKTERAKSDSAKKKPIEKKAKTAVKKTAVKAEKTKGAFARKLKDVKSTASTIGQKIAVFAKGANKQSENLEDAIAAGLQGMKKDIHRVAGSIAEKTK